MNYYFIFFLEIKLVTMVSSLSSLAISSIIKNKVDISEYTPFLKNVGIELPCCEYCDFIVYSPKTFYCGSGEKKSFMICEKCYENKTFCFTCEKFKPAQEIYKTITATSIGNDFMNTTCKSCIEDHHACFLCEGNDLAITDYCDKKYEDDEEDDGVDPFLVKRYFIFPTDVLNVCRSCDSENLFATCKDCKAYMKDDVEEYCGYCRVYFYTDDD